MKKKVIIVTVVLAFILTACGSSTGVETPEPVEDSTVAEQSVENETAEVVEELVTEPSIANEEENRDKAEVEEEKPVFEGLTEEWALEKLGLAKTAYKELTDHMDKPAESNALYCFFTNQVYSMDLKTKDGIILVTDSKDNVHISGGIYEGVCTYYFDNFINNGGEYFDFADFISSHTLEEIDIYDISKNLACDTDDNYMRGLILCESLYGNLSVKNIVNDNFEKTEIKMPNNEIMQVAYQCDIFMEDKDTGLKMWFDENGNLLNIGGTNVQIEIVIPFEN